MSTEIPSISRAPTLWSEGKATCGQWRVIDALTEIFPNIQFIAATHSPIIVSSCKDANIINLDENGNVRYINDSYAFSVNDILRDMLGISYAPGKS